jgi:hypothetical protein
MIALDSGAFAQTAEFSTVYSDLTGALTKPVRFIAKKWYTARGMARQDLVGWYDWIAVDVVSIEALGGPEIALRGRPMMLRQGQHPAARALFEIWRPDGFDAAPVIMYAGATSEGVDILAVEITGATGGRSPGSWIKARCSSGRVSEATRSEAPSSIRQRLDQTAEALCKSP